MRRAVALKTKGSTGRWRIPKSCMLAASALASRHSRLQNCRGRPVYCMGSGVPHQAQTLGPTMACGTGAVVGSSFRGVENSGGSSSGYGAPLAV